MQTLGVEKNLHKFNLIGVIMNGLLTLNECSDCSASCIETTKRAFAFSKA